MADDRPIAIFDTGPAAIAFVEELRARTSESAIVLLDVMHHPLGTYYPSQVRSVAVAAMLLLQDAGAKLGLVASAPATALAMSAIQESLAVPVVGAIVPAAAAAVRATRSGRIAVIAGPQDATCSYELVRRINEMGPTIGVLQQTSSDLDLLLGEGLARNEALARIRATLAPAHRVGADVILFGSPAHCRLAGLVEEAFPSRFRVVDVPAAVCARVVEVLRQNRMLGPVRGGRTLQILSTGALGVEFAAAGRRASMSLPEAHLVTLVDPGQYVPNEEGQGAGTASSDTHTDEVDTLPMLTDMNRALAKEAVRVLDF